MEAGAAACDFDSVTLPFELHLNWTGKALPTLYQWRKRVGEKYMGGRTCCVADPHHFDADSDADPDPTYHFDADPDVDSDS